MRPAWYAHGRSGLNGAKAYYEEKHDKATFVKSIISDNILLGDIYVRAKELHFTSERPLGGVPGPPGGHYGYGRD